MSEHNIYAAFYDDSTDEEDTQHNVTHNSKREELLRCGRAFWLEQQRGNRMKWGDWCDDSDHEQEQPQTLLSDKQDDGFIVQKKKNKKSRKKGKRC